MATNKNQHFVPRCYLRPFSLDKMGMAISLINLDRKVLISDAPLKNQCSKDYFYGSDEILERAIQLIESGYSKVLRKLDDNNKCFSEIEKKELGVFWLFQHLRTDAAAKRAVEMANRINSTIDSKGGEFSLNIKEAVLMACRNFSRSLNEIDDLKCCLLINKTSVPFITSDNPAVLTNRWQLDRKKSLGLSFGMVSAGAIVILPMTPKLMFLGYDGDVYTMPNNNGLIDLKADRDAIALNRHQFLQCAANVYIHDVAFGNLFLKHYKDIEHLRPKERHSLSYAQIIGEVGNAKRYEVIHPDNRDITKEAILHSQVIYPNPGIWPSHFQIRSSGAVFTDGSGMGYVRRFSADVLATGNFRKERAK